MKIKLIVESKIPLYCSRTNSNALYPPYSRDMSSIAEELISSDDPMSVVKDIMDKTLCATFSISLSRIFIVNDRPVKGEELIFPPTQDTDKVICETTDGRHVVTRVQCPLGLTSGSPLCVHAQLSRKEIFCHFSDSNKSETLLEILKSHLTSFKDLYITSYISMGFVVEIAPQILFHNQQVFNIDQTLIKSLIPLIPEVTMP